jgi:hypothetical protein
MEYPENMTSLDEREDHHKNLLSYDSEISLDIPPHMDSIIVYRATLGHKVQRVFKKLESRNFSLLAMTV